MTRKKVREDSSRLFTSLFRLMTIFLGYKRVWCEKCARFSRTSFSSNRSFKFCNTFLLSPTFVQECLFAPKYFITRIPHSSFSSSLPSLSFTSPTLRVVREFENKGICLGWDSSFYLRGLLRAICLLHAVRNIP